MSVSESPETPAEPRGHDDAAGVLGNLPRSRPAVRSPNRSDPPPEMRAAARGEERPEPAPPDPAQASAGEAELERLARAGASAAVGAAGLGLRLAGRAATTLRDVLERR
jgi:hypothetical protein